MEAEANELVSTYDLQSILSSPTRDFLVRNNGDQVKVETLKGKKLGLYFSASWCNPCMRFTPDLVEAYNALASKGDFEVVFVSADKDEESFNGYFSKMPWLAIPFSDNEARDSLDGQFKVRGIPHLVLLDEEGRVRNASGVEIVREYGADAYPFTEDRLKELQAQEEAARREQSLRTVLVSRSRDFVIASDGKKIPVSDLMGKNILLYFSAHWCPPCRAFLPKLLEAYHKIKAKDDAFEIIFISSDRDQESFDEFFSGMPWLALPFGDTRKASLSRRFKVQGIPMLVAIGPTGQTVTKEARNLIMLHGDGAYPFTEDRLKEIEAEIEEQAKEWPKKLMNALHEKHELVLARRSNFICDACNDPGEVWSFYCEECDFDLHPKCALEEEKGTKTYPKQEGEAGEGWVCDGDVCKKA